MGKFDTRLNERLGEFITAQHIFFNASAPNEGLPWQAAHRAHIEAAEGLLLGGNLTDPEGAALILVAAESRQSVEAFAAADPYVTGGVIARWYVRGWDVVVGGLRDIAATLLLPEQDRP